ncbi:MAG: response regulator transcription factor [Acidimicrobiales bacterium]
MAAFPVGHDGERTRTVGVVGTERAAPNQGAQSSATVLVVEDERSIADALIDRLDAEGFGTLRAEDGPSAVDVALDAMPDLIILDLNLPGFDGLEVCRRVHAVRRVPVIMLTARSDETDLLVGLGLGADDYLTKPFSMKELTARVRAVLRRAGEVGAVTFGPLTLDPARRLAEFDGEAVHLTPTEFDLLRALHDANGAVLSRLQLLDKVWGYRDGSIARTVDSHIRSIRRKTNDDLIRTVHGVGYSLGEPVS